jgi:linoleoyl-CoA desaturase
MLRAIRHKIGRQALKDYVLWPMLAGPFFAYVFAANAAANVIRNLWTYVIIFCGHFPDGVRYFTKRRSRRRRARAGTCGSFSAPATSAEDALRRADGEPESPDRASPLSRHAEQPLPGGRAARPCAVCALRSAVHTASLRRQFGTTMRKILRFALPIGTAVPA